MTLPSVLIKHQRHWQMCELFGIPRNSNVNPVWLWIGSFKICTDIPSFTYRSVVVVVVVVVATEFLQVWTHAPLTSLLSPALFLYNRSTRQRSVCPIWRYDTIYSYQETSLPCIMSSSTKQGHDVTDRCPVKVSNTCLPKGNEISHVLCILSGRR